MSLCENLDGQCGKSWCNCDEVRKRRAQGSFAAPTCSAYSSESGKAVLEEVYQWLNNGPMDSWAMRCILHRKIGDMLGHERVEYHE